MLEKINISGKQIHVCKRYLPSKSGSKIAKFGDFAATFRWEITFAETIMRCIPGLLVNSIDPERSSCFCGNWSGFSQTDLSKP